MDAARDTAEAVARAFYGRLVALLAARTRDIAAAEDALAEAFRRALETWPVQGVPDRPEAWLLTVARRAHGHVARHGAVQAAAAPTLLLSQEEAVEHTDALPDARLKLLFVCAHPAIDEAARAPLMLQTVLGLDAARIAASFLVAPSAMAQRLVRAKAKIRDAGIRFREPEPDALADRLPPVLSAIYAAFGAGWEESAAGETGLAHEAIFLARLLVALLPDQPEARGLLALMLYCEARRPARRSAAGAFVPLEAQDTKLWSRPLIIEAERLLTEAARAGRFGRFQTEAAIQSVHAQRAITGTTNRAALVALYDVLAGQVPAVGVLVSRAAVHGDAFGPAAGLALLDAIAPARVGGYQPYWAVRAHLLGLAGRAHAARDARARAIALATDPAVAAYLAGLG
jgi:RNA polymerase sigma-70 factor (ECF subfamily)